MDYIIIITFILIIVFIAYRKFKKVSDDKDCCK